MTTITLNSTRVVSENQTTRYWRDVQCDPQTVDLQTWSTDHPYFILTGVVVSSHDPKEIGMKKDVLIQTYSFWLNVLVDEGKFTINKES